MSTTSIQPETTDLAPITPPEQPPREGVLPEEVAPKAQLRRRVESRLEELDAALASLDKGAATQETRHRAIETETQLARDNLVGGWEQVGEMEAAQLSKWLERTEQLVVTEPQPGATPSQGAAPAGGIWQGLQSALKQLTTKDGQPIEAASVVDTKEN